MPSAREGPLLSAPPDRRPRGEGGVHTISIPSRSPVGATRRGSVIKGCGDRYGSPRGMIFAWTVLSGGRGNEDAGGGLFHVFARKRGRAVDEQAPVGDLFGKAACPGVHRHDRAGSLVMLRQRLVLDVLRSMFTESAPADVVEEGTRPSIGRLDHRSHTPTGAGAVAVPERWGKSDLLVLTAVCPWESLRLCAVRGFGGQCCQQSRFPL